MGNLVLSDGTTLLHPREDYVATGVINTGGGTVTFPVMHGTATVAIDLRGAGITGSPTGILEGSVDGTNFITIGMFTAITMAQVSTLSIPAVGGNYFADVAAFRLVRFRCIAAPSAGTYTVTLRASNSDAVAIMQPIPATVLGTATGAAAAAVTLTLTSGGTGLFHYLTRLRIESHPSALLTAAATPVIVTTTNIPGSLAFSIPADARAQGVPFIIDQDHKNPIRSTAAGTNTTIVCPVTTAVIWRVTAYGYVGP
jgi:hypothetical protein